MRKTHALLLQLLLLPLPRNHAKDEPPRHTKTPPNFVPKRRQKGTAKLPNVPSESLEKNYKSRNTHAALLQLLLLPLPQSHAKDEPLRHTKTPSNFVPKRRQKGTAKLPNVPSESLEKRTNLETHRLLCSSCCCCHCHKPMQKTNPLATPKHHLISCRKGVKKGQQNCLTSLLNL